MSEPIQRYRPVHEGGFVELWEDATGSVYKGSEIDPLLREVVEALAAEQSVLHQLTEAYHSQQAFQLHLRMADLLARLTAVLDIGPLK